jgi:protease I
MLQGRRIAILAQQGFGDVELMELLRAMRHAGGRVVVIGSGPEDVCRGRRGTAVVKVECRAEEVSAEEFDAVIVPGGAERGMNPSPAMVALVKRADDGGRVLAAICYGPRLFILADIVGGRRLTSRPSLAVELQNAGARWADEPVVRDGNLITSRKPADLPRFIKAIIGAVVESAPAAGGISGEDP